MGRMCRWRNFELGSLPENLPPQQIFSPTSPPQLLRRALHELTWTRFLIKITSFRCRIQMTGACSLLFTAVSQVFAVQVLSTRQKFSDRRAHNTELGHDEDQQTQHDLHMVDPCFQNLKGSQRPCILSRSHDNMSVRFTPRQRTIETHFRTLVTTPMSVTCSSTYDAMLRDQSARLPR
jgi:hypothetical protein